jgi:HAMP domain-containing protein
MRENDKAVFYVVMALDDGELMIGSLDPAFIRQVQRSITFGERGHSMIVDATGRVVAHPNAEWEASSKDASKLSVVQKMMRGETGVTQFYSPPMAADMIAGHTTVPGVGWGVMVPQPMSELAARAREVRNATIIVSAIGIVIASVIAWLLARFLAAPIVAVARATSAVATGSYDIRPSAHCRGAVRANCGCSRTGSTT